MEDYIEDKVTPEEEKTTVLDVVLLELDMYLYHLRVRNGVRNKGWLRNDFYSMGQQVMRQSPTYFAVYSTLRPVEAPASSPTSTTANTRRRRTVPPRSSDTSTPTSDVSNSTDVG